MSVTKAQPSISVVGDDVVIRVPRVYFEQNGREAVSLGQKTTDKKEDNQIGPKTQRRTPVDFSYLVGVLKDVPEFQGKTSVEVQHMITDIWIKKAMDYHS